MDRRRPARRPARGGGDIPALRKTRTRIVLGGLSASAYASAFAYVVVREPATAAVAGALGGMGALLLALALWRGHDALVPWPLVCIGLAYTAALLVHGSAVDQGVPLVAAALLLCGELAAWSIDERHGIATERTVVAGRAVAVAALALAGLAAAGIVVALSAVPAGSGLAWTVAGAAAAVTLGGLAAGFARRA